jgi:hypothetical protein
LTQWGIPSLRLQGVNHFLKLRTSAKLNNSLSANFGVDYSVSNKKIYPVAAIDYKVAVSVVCWSVCLHVTHYVQRDPPC